MTGVSSADPIQKQTLSMEERSISEKESLQLITSMINKAKNSYHDTGQGAILWGSVIAVCSLVELAQMHYNFKLSVDIYWLSFIAIIPQIIFTIRQKKQRIVQSHDDVVMDYLWLGFGICIFLLVHANLGVFRSLNQFQHDYQELSGSRHQFRFSDHVLSYFLLLYGFPTFVTGAIMKFKPMLWGGIFCWICSAICIYTHMQIDLMLTALSAILAWLIPGILLRQRYLRNKTIREELDV
jgi:hypothetical protein